MKISTVNMVLVNHLKNRATTYLFWIGEEYEFIEEFARHRPVHCVMLKLSFIYYYDEAKVEKLYQKNGITITRNDRSFNGTKEDLI